jgi:hypothetical protein
MADRILALALSTLAACVTLALAQPDTLVLNQTEVRFPETRPGEVFLVRKVVVDEGGALRKSAKEVPADASGQFRTPRAMNRDVLGRSFGDAYRSRLARIRVEQALPTFARSEKRSTPAAKFKPPQRVSRGQVPRNVRPMLTSNSAIIRSAADLTRMEREEHEALRRRYGAMASTFAKDLDKLGPLDSVQVVIHLKRENPGYVDRYKATQATQLANAAAWRERRPLAHVSTIARKHKLESRARIHGNSMVARLSKAEAREIAHDPDIAAVEKLNVPITLAVPGTAPVHLNTLISSAYNPANEMVNYGDVNVATIEYGLRTSFVNSIASDLRPTQYETYLPPSHTACDTATTSNPYMAFCDGLAPHTESTYYLLAAGTPESNRFHIMHDWLSFEHFDDITSLEVNSVSMSLGYEYDASNTTDAEPRAWDRLAYLYPYPVVVLPAGNEGSTHTPDHHAYNALIVGIAQHYDNDSYNCDLYWGTNPADITNTVNPPAKYGSDRDRELPSLLTPGWTPDPWWGLVHPSIFFGTIFHAPSTPYVVNGGGTSYSAPVANAIAANVLSMRGLYGWSASPEAVRAILMLTASDVDGNAWDVGDDGVDGAGAISGADAVNFASSATTLFSGSENGAEAGLSYWSFGEENEDGEFLFNVLTPSELPEGKHLRVVLTWSSSPANNLSQNRLSDLDLRVASDWSYFYSASWEDNVELVDIPNSELTPDTMYEIKAWMNTFRAADDGPTTQYAAIAWGWVRNNVNAP